MPITPIATGGGGTGGEVGTEGGSELEAPGVEDAPAINEPQTLETLSAVASAVSSRTAILADEQIDVGVQPTSGTGAGDRRTPGFGGGRGGGIGGGIGSGSGPGRNTGPGEPRREIRFEPANVREYGQWLDYFKIELGVLGQDNKVYYVYNLSQDKPDVRVGDPKLEQRLYMNPTDSQFAALDRQLAVKAGVADKGRIILQFYPPEAQAILVGLEQKHAGARKPEEIRSTAFRVTRRGTRFRVQRGRSVVPVGTVGHIQASTSRRFREAYRATPRLRMCTAPMHLSCASQSSTLPNAHARTIA